MASITIKIEGLDQLQRAFDQFGPAASRAVDSGLRAGAVLVEGAAKRSVHSDKNIWTGSRNPGYQPPTGKLQAAISTGPVEGSGIDKQISVGLASRGGTFARSYRTVDGKSASRKNRGDVQVYGPIEERKHPFLGPALLDQKAEISRAFWQRFNDALAVFRRVA